MYIFGHRGNFRGPERNDGPALVQENSISHIWHCLKQGVGAEIDVWSIAGTLFLGHDKPIWETSLEEIGKFGWNNLLIHCKNGPALEVFTKTKSHYFYHQKDHYTLSSLGHPICYPGVVPIRNCIYVGDDLNQSTVLKCWGIVTDFPLIYKELI